MPALSRQPQQRAEVVFLTSQPPQQVEMLASYPDLLRPSHIAELLGISEATARAMCRDGQLPAIKIGAFWYCSKSRFIQHVEGD